MHDERYFKDPHEFQPERFIKHPLGVRLDVDDDPARRANLMFGGKTSTSTREQISCS